MIDLRNKELLSDKVGIEASIISKNKKIRNLVHSFQVNSLIILQKSIMVHV